MRNLLKWEKHLFVPHPANNYRAKLLHPSILSFIVALFLVCQFGLNYFIAVQPSVLGFASQIRPERVIELTNQERLKSGLPPLEMNNLLNQAAQLKAGDMFAFDYWAHDSPSGRTPWAFFKEAGYKYLYAGENLARDFMTPEAVVAAWMNSPTHRDNLLNNKYQEIGLAVVDGSLEGVETTLVVQLFGTPVPASLAQGSTSSMTPGEEVILPTPELGEASAVEEKAPLIPVALAQAEGERLVPPVLSPFWLTKTIAIFFLGIVLGVLTLDVIVVYRKRIVRLSGRNLAHLLFVGTLLLALILTTPGAIL